MLAEEYDVALAFAALGQALGEEREAACCWGYRGQCRELGGTGSQVLDIHIVLKVRMRNKANTWMPVS